MGIVVLLLYVAFVRLVERRPVDELGRAGAVRRSGARLRRRRRALRATIVILVVDRRRPRRPRRRLARAPSAGSAAIAAGLTEETMVRAIFFRIVEESLGTWIALAASAALFGLLHVVQPRRHRRQHLAIALEAGVLLAAAYVFTRRLWMAIGLHTAWNFSEGGIFGASVSGTKPGASCEPLRRTDAPLRRRLRPRGLDRGHRHLRLDRHRAVRASRPPRPLRAPVLG